MKLNKDFITHQSDGEWFLIPVGGAGFSGIVKGNKTLGLILEQLKQDTTEEEIVAALRDRFEAPEGLIEDNVKEVLENLRGIGALDE